MTNKLKLLPREATREMLEAMDECSMEGYDERLYAGHAASVYMAAWDAFHGQLCYCGDITNLGVIHRDDGPCHYPDHKKPEQEPVAWRYKPVREDNPRWEYTTNHPLDMGDGYLRPSLVEYCKCIEPLYAKEKPKLMLEKFREMKDLLDDTTPPQRKPLPYEKVVDLWLARFDTNEYDEVFMNFARAIEAAHGIKG